MSARGSKKLNKSSKKPAKRASAKDHLKRPSGRSKAAPKPKQQVRAGSTAKVAKPSPHRAAKHVLPKKGGKVARPPVKARSNASSADAKRRQREQEQKAHAKSVAVEKKARDNAKRLAQQLREREAKAKAEQKRKEIALKQREADRVRAQKEKAQEQKRKEAERRAAQKQKETESKRKEAERQRLAHEAEKRREAERKAREQEKARQAAEKQAAKEAQRVAAEQEKLRKQQEREAARIAKEQERLQQKAQREAEREEARRLKEEERAKREAEREAYRKAKEAEREKIRAAKEAARRALEGRIAEATRNANKLGGGRSTTTRIYSPRAIPDQSGTTRRVQASAPMVPSAVNPNDAETTSVAPEAAQIAPSGTTASAAPPLYGEVPSQPPIDGVPQPGAAPAGAGQSSEDEAKRASERAQPIPENIEDRYRVIEERLKAAPDAFNRDYRETIDMSWIHHDSALEGVVYTFQELKTAIDPSTSVVTDTSLQPVIEEIRRHKQAIDLVRDLGERKRAPITVDTIKKIYVTLHPEEGDVKTVKYRRDIPQHRLYFHEYAHPEKITYKVRQIVDWFNGPEPKKLKSPIRVAARVHYELLRVFPFQTDSGKVARLVMNLILLRAGHPPAIIHSTERQRYYEALKGALPVLVQMVTESILNAVASIEKLLDDHDIHIRSRA